MASERARSCTAEARGATDGANAAAEPRRAAGKHRRRVRSQCATGKKSVCLALLFALGSWRRRPVRGHQSASSLAGLTHAFQAAQKELKMTQAFQCAHTHAATAAVFSDWTLTKEERSSTHREGQWRLRKGERFLFNRTSAQRMYYVMFRSFTSPRRMGAGAPARRKTAQPPSCPLN